jgi:hypothetical protein
MAIMRNVDAIDLTKLPIVNIKGDAVYLSEEGFIVFPQITRQRNLEITTLPNNFVEGFVLNDKVFLVLSRGDLYDVFYENTIRTFTKFAGVVVFGDVIFCFVDNNRCLVINTATNEVKTITISEPSNIVFVYQLSAYLFAVITTSPTTVYIYSMDDAGSIATANDGDVITLPAYTYGVFANPKVNPRLVKKDNLLYLIGDDATVLLSFQISDMIYLRTEETALQKISPFPEFEEQGLEFVREVQNFFLFRNSLFNNFVWISKGDRRVYFSTNYLYLSQHHVIYDRNLYTLQDVIDPDQPNIPLQKEFTVKFKKGGLNGISLEVLETTDYDLGHMVVLNRFLDFQNFFNYYIHATRTHYRLAVRGEEFVVSLYTDQACRIRSFQAW